jgi:multidrug resistance efflux pump
LRRQSANRAAKPNSAPRAAAAADSITLPVRIQARQIVPVRADLDGTVSEMLVENGQEVYLGQLIARITNQGMEGAREAAQAAAENAQARVTRTESAIIAARMEASRARADAQRSQQEFERADKLYRRQKYLYSEGATPRLTYEKSEKEFHNAQTEYTSLDTLARHSEERVDALMAELQGTKKILEDKNRQLEGATADLTSGEVHSPVDGVVVARKADPGKAVSENEGKDLYEIAINPTALEAVLEADPSAIQRLQPGQPATLFFADVPNEGIQGTIREIRGGQAFIDFTSPDPLTIKHGMTAQVRLKM